MLMSGHHLILGTLTDVVTGETIDDTLDERYRQKIARLLLEHKALSAGARGNDALARSYRTRARALLAHAKPHELGKEAVELGSRLAKT